MKTFAPVVGFATVLLLTLATLVGLGFSAWQSFQIAKTLQGREFRILELTGVVTHLDEVLTMSARMGVTTGDPRWEQRYRHFEPQLEDAIEELTRLAPEPGELDAAAQTNLANEKLVEMERNAFELSRDGRRDEAQRLLFSEGYEGRKRAYAEGMEKSLTFLRSRALEAMLIQRRRTALAVVAVLVALPMLAFAWLCVLRMLRRHLLERRNAEEALRSAHDNLERQVEKRTCELRSANESLKREITDRKRAEEELRESSAELARVVEEQKLLLEHTSDFVYRHDTKGVFNYLSPAVEQVTGYSVREWRKHYATYLTDHSVNQKVIEYKEETVRTGKENPPYLVEIAHKDGHPIMLEVSERPYFEEGEVAGIVGVARDVTERHRASAELEKAKEAAEAANRAKSIFLANMSHEVRTPLTAMLGAAELLATGRGDADRDDNRCDMIIRNGRHLLALINDLLDVSQAEGGGLDVEQVPAALQEILADVQAITGPLHTRPAVDFRFRYETPIPATIRTDPTRLKQAFINMISNALKFTEAGHVWVRIAVDRHGPEPRLSVVVEDSGRGIPPGDIDRIFDTFTRIAPQSTPMSDGLGLGLPLVQRIAEKLGGSIEVAASEHHGSTFTLHVATGSLENTAWTEPAEIEMTPGSKPIYRGAAEGERLCGSVLLAEDFPDTRKLIAEILTSKGARVTAVENGEAAIEAAMTQTFDVVLMDIRMPGMGGLEATAELRSRGCLAPIIALTASTTGADRERILDAGFDELWAKPMTLEHLVGKVAAHLPTTFKKPDVAHPPEHQRSASIQDNPRLEAIRVDFIRNLPTRMSRITGAVNAKDVREAREALHQLVGAAGIQGLMPISHEAARLLVLAKDAALADRRNELRHLQELVNQATDALTVKPADTPGPPASGV